MTSTMTSFSDVSFENTIYGYRDKNLPPIKNLAFDKIIAVVDKENRLHVFSRSQPIDSIFSEQLPKTKRNTFLEVFYKSVFVSYGNNVSVFNFFNNKSKPDRQILSLFSEAISDLYINIKQKVLIY